MSVTFGFGSVAAGRLGRRPPPVPVPPAAAGVLPSQSAATESTGSRSTVSLPAPQVIVSASPSRASITSSLAPVVTVSRPAPGTMITGAGTAERSARSSRSPSVISAPPRPELGQ